MKSDNPAREKSYAFALRMVKLYRFLCDERIMGEDAHSG
jgi:hypothetical protein